MKNIIIKPGSPWQKFSPLVQRLRCWAEKFHDRMGQRLVISGGRVRFMDADLAFPEGVAVSYSTPLFWNGPDAYESPTSRALALLASRANSFLDVGSNMGIYAVYVGVKFPQVAVFAFEPVPSIWEKNRRFHQANGLSDQRVLNLALSDRASRQTMVLPIGSGGLEEEQTATLRQDIWQGKDNQVTQFEIECVTLDSFAAQNPLPAGLCCVKIDVENFEAAVFQGGRQFFRERRPWIVCEILPDQGVAPASGKKFNDNGAVVAEIRESRYTPFAIMAEGYFRMTPADFERPRGFKDFLLIPAERLAADHAYLSPSCLDGLLPKP
jgi:FkbM family methyltransferase